MDRQPTEKYVDLIDNPLYTMKVSRPENLKENFRNWKKETVNV